MDTAFKLTIEANREEKELVRTLNTLFATRAATQPAGPSNHLP